MLSRENAKYLYSLLWLPYRIMQVIIFLPCGFFLFSFFPRLMSAAADWIYHTFTCGVALVRI